ncbi:MAG: glycosyltransferase family 4 protein [Lachnospiraceae bacterium]|nr:glycosyltransferase family 4 protein [Lachnospiraceae bacterium]
MKVLITSDWYTSAVNGVVTSILNLKRGLEGLGHEVRILTLSNTIKSYMKEDVYFIGSVSAGIVYPGARLRTARGHKMLQEIIDWHPDIVHSNCEFSTFFIAHYIAKKAGIPMIHTYHTVYENYTHYFSPSLRLGKKAVRLFSRWVSENTDYLIAPTEKVKMMLEDYDVYAPIEVVPTGIDLDRFYQPMERAEIERMKRELRIPESDTVLVFIGRLSKEKNCEELLSAMKHLKKRAVTLLFVGDGPYREALEKYVEEEELSEQVIFTGMVSPEEVWEYYRLGDLFISGSTSETQGLTYIEAMASGMPLLCRKDECLDDILFNGINGWQYTSEQELVEKVEEYQNHLQNQQLLCQNAKTISEKYSIDAFACSVESVYKKALTKVKSEPERISA